MLFFCTVLIGVLVSYSFLANSKQLTPLTATSLDNHSSFINELGDINWPAEGLAAIGFDNGRIISSTADQEVIVPTASLTKLMTVLAVLEKHPLTLNEAGPLIAVTEADEALYRNYVAQDGSVVPVQAGVSLTQLQAIQAILMASANNVADMLAVWAYGSMENYHEAAKSLAESYGMKNTNFGGDASGLSPLTTSTPHDLVLLAQHAYKHPVIAEITVAPTAELPVAGLIYNLNYLASDELVTGIKIGLTDEAGGCFIFMSEQNIAGKNMRITAVITGASDLQAAVNSAPLLAQNVFSQLRPVTVIEKGQTIAQYNPGWSKAIEVVATKDITLYGIGDTDFETFLNIRKLESLAPAGSIVGTVAVKGMIDSGSSEVALATELTAPSFWYKFSRFGL